MALGQERPGLRIGLTFCKFAGSWWEEGRQPRAMGLGHQELSRGLRGSLTLQAIEGRARPRVRATCWVSQPSCYPPFPCSFIRSFIQTPAYAGRGHKLHLIRTRLP